MNTILIWIVTVIYVGQAILMWRDGNFPNVIVFGGYAAANVGLIWAIKLQDAAKAAAFGVN
jgi:hypothetical protein